MKNYFNTSYYKMLLVGTAIASCQGTKHHRAHDDKPSDIDRQPIEMLWEIAKHLSTDELIAMSQVDRRIHFLIKREVYNKYNRHKKPYEIDGSNQAHFEEAIRFLTYFKIGHARYRIIDRSLSSNHIVKLSELPFVKSLELVDREGRIETFLDLSDSNINDNQLNYLLKILKNRSDLEYLSLKNNKLTKLLWDLPKLIELNLSKNRIKQFSGNLSELKFLDLSENQIETFPVFILQNVPQLCSLRLDSNQFETVAISAPHLSLKHLSLGNNAIRICSGLENLPQLQSLYLEGNKLATLEGLANHPQLRFLNISNNELATFEGLEALPELISLSLRENKIETIAAVVAGLTNLQQLIWLSLEGNQLTDEDIEVLRQGYPNMGINIPT